MISYKKIASAATFIAVGNVASRVLGLAREVLKSHLFGAGGSVDAINVAMRIPLLLNDLLVGGMIGNLLIPIFSEYVQKDRAELWRLASVLFSIITGMIALLVLVIELFAPQVVYYFSGGSPDDVQRMTTELLRFTVLALVILSASGVLSGLLYALKRFVYPAMPAAVFNGFIVVWMLFFCGSMGVSSMAAGMLVGAVVSLLIQVPGLRDFRYRPAFRHPELRRVFALYIPILLGLLLDILVSKPATYNLASQTGVGAISWMDYATTLWQFPQGVVSVAISFAVLPTLSAQAAQNAYDDFRQTLNRGLQFILALILPTALVMFIFAHPIVALVLEHGSFTPHDTLMTGQALRLYLIGLPFNAVDLLLVFAFYARQNTLTPALIGAGTTVIYLVMAFVLVPIIGLSGIMLSDSFRIAIHAVLCAWLLYAMINPQTIQKNPSVGNQGKK